MENLYDVIIIGSGPAGLSAAIYAKRAKLSSLTIEANFASGGQVLNTYEVDNYPGLPGISGMDLGSTLRAHAEKMGAEFSRERVKELVLDEEIKIVRTRKNEYHARTVILATGAEHRALNVPGEKELSGMGVSYCATCDGAFYKGKTAAVLGGGDTALDDALYLSDICEKVYLVHRRDSFRGAQSTVELLKQKENVELVLNETVTEIYGEKKPTGIKLKSGRTLAVDGVFVAYGSVPQSELIKNLVQLDERGYVVAGEDGITYAATKNGDHDRSVQPGLYVAGDVRTKTLRQVVTAVSDGANAATTAAEYLRDINGYKQNI